MVEFEDFRNAVSTQFKRMSAHQLYRTAVSKDQMWEMYLSSFPEGTNPIYRERTVHDCNCCKQFIRAVGNVVAFIDGNLTSIWDVKVKDEGYQTVANALNSLVLSAEIENVFLHYEKTAGTEKSYEETVAGVKTWDHFFVNIPAAYVRDGKSIATELGDVRATYDVFLRGLKELTVDSVETVLELIAQNSLYRGEEHKVNLQKFLKLKQKFLSETVQEDFVWNIVKTTPVSVARIRNTAIGTLLIDLSNGVELDTAVSAFERVVAPSNYKRPKALVTQGMIDKAKATITELGLTSALERRYATIDDIGVNDLLYVDRYARALDTDVFDGIATKKGKVSSKVEEVTIDTLLKDILPKAESIEVMVESRHAGNLVSLVAPVDPTARQLFKWDNGFSWSYNGDVADSIKERVKNAGGNVVGDLCCRLAWYNYDDLDLHMIEPKGNKIYFGNERSVYTDGQLDVDMNAGAGYTRTPVENIFYGNSKKMTEGVYSLRVHNYSKRENDNVGFEVEIDFKGSVYSFAYPQEVGHGAVIEVAAFSYSHKDGIKIIRSLPCVSASKEVWGIKTNEFTKVRAIMLSPNYWGGQVGNKHYMFMLDGCVNEGTARGFYNEFLREELTPHRKVIEIVGSKMRTERTEDQLSGVGFSSTQRNDFLCRVTGSFTRTIKVII